MAQVDFLPKRAIFEMSHLENRLSDTLPQTHTIKHPVESLLENISLKAKELKIQMI